MIRTPKGQRPGAPRPRRTRSSPARTSGTRSAADRSSTARSATARLHPDSASGAQRPEPARGRRRVRADRNSGPFSADGRSSAERPTLGRRVSTGPTAGLFGQRPGAGQTACLSGRRSVGQAPGWRHSPGPPGHRAHSARRGAPSRLRAAHRPFTLAPDQEGEPRHRGSTPSAHRRDASGRGPGVRGAVVAPHRCAGVLERALLGHGGQRGRCHGRRTRPSEVASTTATVRPWRCRSRARRSWATRSSSVIPFSWQARWRRCSTSRRGLSSPSCRSTRGSCLWPRRSATPRPTR